MEDYEEHSDRVHVLIDKGEYWQIQEKARVLKFMLDSNTMSLIEYCQITGRTPNFRVRDCSVISGYHAALFEIYDNMQMVARTFPEDKSIYNYL